MAILGQVDCWGGRPQLWWTWRIFPARSAGSFYLALLLAVWPKHAQAANGTVVPSGAFAVPCKVNADCPYGRMDCNAGWPSTGPSVCRCAMWFYTDQAPRCRDVNMNTLAVSFMMIVVAACSLASARLHLRALRDHLSRPCPDDPERRRVDCSRSTLLTFKTPFLVASLVFGLSLALRTVGWVVLMWGADDFRWWTTSPSSPYLWAFSIWAFATGFWVLLLVCLWVRVAARLHDPRQPPKGCIWRLVTWLDGSGLGTLLAGVLCLSVALGIAWSVTTLHPDVATQLTLVVVLLASMCLFLGTWLLRSARDFNRRPARQARAWCWKRSRARVAADDAAGQPATGHQPGPPAMQGGKPHFQRHDKEEHQHGDDEVRPFRPEDFIDSCSVGGSMTLYSSISPVGRPAFLQPTPTADREEAAAVGSLTPRGSRPTGQQPDEPSGLELKLVMVHRDAHALATRAAILLTTGATCFLAAQFCLANRLTILVQTFRLLGTLAWLSANLSCLYYLSPSFRHTVMDWLLSDSCTLSLIAVLLDPHSGAEARDAY